MPTAEGVGEGAGSSGAPNGSGAAATASVTEAFDLKPRNSGGNVTGVIVGPGRNPALFQLAGFRSGDVIVAVNGARISSLIDVQHLQSSLAPGARLTLTVERGGQTLPIALNIPANQ
jgi:general secretion pathway protein C